MAVHATGQMDPYHSGVFLTPSAGRLRMHPGIADIHQLQSAQARCWSFTYLRLIHAIHHPASEERCICGCAQLRQASLLPGVQQARIRTARMLLCHLTTLCDGLKLTMDV